MDKISVTRIGLLHPKLRPEGLVILGKIEQALRGRARCRVTYTLRTFAEQQALYDQGRTKQGSIVTNAKAGQSLHNYGLALDIALLVDTDANGTFETTSWNTTTDFDGDKLADWLEIVAIFNKHGWTWGADWNGNGITKAQGDTNETLVDAPHFQKTFGHTWQQCLALHNAGKVDKQGYILL